MHDIEGDYSAQDVAPEDLAGFVRTVGVDGLRGCNVTIPHKVAVMALADHVTPVARAIGAANTLWFADGALHATNTDVSGYMAHLSASAPELDLRDAHVLVFGAGGAARAIIYGLLRAGVRQIVVANRTRENVEKLQRDFGPQISHADDVEHALLQADLVVNTTSLGMVGQPALSCDVSLLKDTAVVSDIVYAPLETPMLSDARRRGLTTVDGLGMLLHQAVEGFALWFGVTPVVDATLRDKVVASLSQR